MNLLKIINTEEYNTLKMNKREILDSIKQRIEAEHRKHKDLDWPEIAARKIYASHFSDSSVIISKDRLYSLLIDALVHGFNSYEENESGLKAFNAEVEAEWLIKKYL